MASERIDEIAERLQGAAERLRSGELSGEEAAVLLEQCAALAGQAGSELAGAAAAAPPPGQDRLL